MRTNYLLVHEEQVRSTCGCSMDMCPYEPSCDRAAVELRMKRWILRILRMSMVAWFGMMRSIRALLCPTECTVPIEPSLCVLTAARMSTSGGVRQGAHIKTCAVRECGRQFARRSRHWQGEGRSAAAYLKSGLLKDESNEQSILCERCAAQLKRGGPRLQTPKAVAPPQLLPPPPPPPPPPPTAGLTKAERRNTSSVVAHLTKAEVRVDQMSAVELAVVESTLR